MQIHQLPPITDIPAASMLAVDNGSVTNYITAANLLKQQTMITFPNTQLLTTTVDGLTVGRAYDFSIAAGNQTASGLPTNRTFVGTAYCYTNDAKIIIIHAVSANEEWYTRKGTSGWDIWRLRSGNMTGTVTRGPMMNATDTIDLTACGSAGILRMGCRIDTAGTYGRNDYLMTTSIKASKTGTGVLMLGSTPRIININSSGNVFFNNDTAVTANQYLIGTIVFPIASWL